MPIKLDPNSEKPLHIQAEEVLRKLIESEAVSYTHLTLPTSDLV